MSDAHHRDRGIECPQLSVIVPVYNGERYLAEALRSIEPAAWRVEVIVVDDGSTDATADVVRDSLVECVCVRQARSGPAAARNRGLSIARAPVVGFLDADDIWPPGKVATQMAFLEDHPAVDIVAGTVQWVTRVPPSGRFEPVGAPITGAQLGCGLFRRRAFEVVGPFDVTRHPSDDVDWWLRAREQALRIASIPDVGLHYRYHDGSLTHGQPATSLGLLRVIKRSLDRRRRAGTAG